MAYEQRDNSGSLFPNDDKKKEGANPKWPDFKGQGMVDGIPVWLSGWKKKDKNNNTFLSISFKPKDAQTQKRQAPQQQSRDLDDGSEIPF